MGSAKEFIFHNREWRTTRRATKELQQQRYNDANNFLNAVVHALYICGDEKDFLLGNIPTDPHPDHYIVPFSPDFPLPQSYILESDVPFEGTNIPKSRIFRPDRQDPKYPIPNRDEFNQRLYTHHMARGSSEV
jgi:hypothetical protein